MSLYSDLLEMENWKAVTGEVFLSNGTVLLVDSVTSVTRDSITVATGIYGDIEYIVPKSSIMYANLHRKEPLK